MWNWPLGEIEIPQKLTLEQENDFKLSLKKAKLEVLDKENNFLFERVKHFLIDYVMNSEKRPISKFSALLSSEFNKEYVYLSNRFSQSENCTIEKYIIKLKIERIKELLIFGEASITEIAKLLQYSSPAHLSNQFKKETGYSPSEFRTLKENKRLILQEI